jgi:hypothetical protein
MNVIPTKIHGIIDYISGVFFCMSPWLFGFATDNADMWIPIILGEWGFDGSFSLDLWICRSGVSATCHFWFF